MRNQGYVAFAVGMCLTVWSCLLMGSAQDAQIRANFQRDTDKVASDTSVRLQTYFDMLFSLKGMFAVNEHADRAQFARFVRELKLTQRYPGFQAIQFVRYVPASGLGAFRDAVRADTTLTPDGYPAFKIHPETARDDHYIIEYNEPMKGNESAFGLDLAALPPHRAAIELGRDSGEVAATGRIELVQDASGQAGFVARAPVYRSGMPTDTVAHRRAALVGMVAIVFRVDRLMREVIDPPLIGHMAIRIYDAGSVHDGPALPPRADKLLFDTGNPALPTLAALRTEARVNVAQRQWVMQFGALAGSRYSRDLTRVLLIGAGGVVISALIAALMIASDRSRTLAARLRVTLDEQRAFQDSASVGIALFADGVIMRCNRGMEEIMGYWPGGLAGQPTRLLSREGTPDPFAVDPQTRRWQHELELVRKDGSPIWCLINGKALDAADLSKGGVWVIQDISERKRTEAALVDAKHGLEHSLAELAQQKKMASLGALVAGIAHELNTPIGNSLLTATALADMVADFEKRYASGGIKRSAFEAHLADSRLACGIMTNSLRRAADLITSFKQVAVDQTSDNRRRFDLCEVLRDTLATYAAQLRRANCEAVLDAPATLVLDSYPGSVGQVLSNLINNALLHAFDGRSSARLTIGARDTGDGQVLIDFRDDGVGMPPKILHQVFDPFFTTKMGQGGSGLGMNIVYNIVTGMLGGTIGIASIPDSGTSVTIRIPKIAPTRDSDAGLSILAL